MAPRFSIIPGAAVTDKTLELRDLAVLCLLGRHTDKAGWCTRSQVRMASELGCGRSSVQRSVERLCEAGYVQKKRRDAAADDADPGQPSASYAYRVVLDRDDEPAQARDTDAGDDDASHAETASEAGGCPPVGTPDVPADGHPGAQPCVGTGAQPYMGTKNDPLERPHLERERDARARATERFLVKFKALWPSAAVDDQSRIARAAADLTEDEQAAALAGIAPFLDHGKKLGRRGCIAGWKYLEERRWTLLERAAAANDDKSGFSLVAPDSAEGRAVIGLHMVAKASRPFLLADGRLSYKGQITPQLLAFATLPPRDKWVWIEDRNQLGAWAGFFDAHVFTPRRALGEKRVVDGRLLHGCWVPWVFPPPASGEPYTDDRLQPVMTADDEQVFAKG